MVGKGSWSEGRDQEWSKKGYIYDSNTLYVQMKMSY